MLVAAALAAVAFSSSASEIDVIVGLDQACPAGTVSNGPAYRWANGRFVREGWSCTDIQGKP